MRYRKNMMNTIKQNLEAHIQKHILPADIVFSAPPNSVLGDFAFPCFSYAKTRGESPAIVAKHLAAKIHADITEASLIRDVRAEGPFVNFFLNQKEMASLLFPLILHKTEQPYGAVREEKRKKIMVEFAHPNTHKMFHIGHLRNIVTGESIIRILENAGHELVRVNYQGDVGMHIAKSLWGIQQLIDEYRAVQEKDIHERMAFLGKAYARGGQRYEDNEETKQEIIALNKKIYANDPSIHDIYQTTRSWSLEYFDIIYQRVGSRFDRLYFESEVFARGEELVRAFLKKGVFKESDGAIIFPGETYGLHDRVFITSQGFPGYEAKEMALGALQFAEHHPDQIIHVVGKEQTGYFQVVFKALEHVVPESMGKEYHLVYGWVHLKHGKMSSRTGNVVLGEELLDAVKDRIRAIMKENTVKDAEGVLETVALSAVKYGFLKTGIGNDIAFDMEESVNISGDSGPYLLYIVARIQSIIRKIQKENVSAPFDALDGDTLETAQEKKLLLDLASFPEAAKEAADHLDPSKIAKYLLELAQDFNAFYHACPVLTADKATKSFRIHLVSAVGIVMRHGLYLLGMTHVEEM